MSYQEKKTLVTLITTIVIFVSYYLYIFNSYNEEFFNSTVDFSFWGAVILILVPVLIIAQIIVHITFHIINVIVTREKDYPEFEDERDKMVDLKATRNFYHVFIAGFFLSIASQVLGLSPVIMFNMFIGSMLMSAIIGGISQFFYYRRGF